MRNNKSIKVNMVMNVILTTSNFFFPLITYSYVARKLLPAGTGKVAFVQSVLAYFTYISALGISTYGIRECAKVRNDKEKLSKLVQELFFINLLSTIVAYVLLICTINFVPKFHGYSKLFLIMSISIGLQTLGVEWLYTALEKYTYITIRSLIFKLISVILTFLLIKGPEDYVMYGGLTVFTTSASYILNFFNAKKYVLLKKFDNYNLKRHLKPIMVFFFTIIITTVYGHFDSLMLGFMQGDNAVGVYNAALKMKTIVLSFSTSVTSVLIPRMSVYVAQKDTKRFNELLVKSLRVTYILLIPLVIFVFINSSDILLFICGPEYLNANDTLRVLMICVIALSFTNIFGNQILIPKGDEKRYSMSVFWGMFINLGLNYMLIPCFSSAGAAIATLATESFNMMWMGHGAREEIKYMFKNVNSVKYLLALGVSILIELIVNKTFAGLHVFFRLSIGTLAMFCVYYFILYLLKEPILCGVLNNLKYRIYNKGRSK